MAKLSVRLRTDHFTYFIQSNKTLLYQHGNLAGGPSVMNLPDAPEGRHWFGATNDVFSRARDWHVKDQRG